MASRSLLGLVAVSFLLAAPCYAEDQPVQPGLEPAPAPPDLPTEVQSGQVLEPEVVITESDEERIEEYKVGGQTVLVKITPKNGPAYYLMDTDGDGSLETRRRDIEPGVVVNSWHIFSW